MNTPDIIANIERIIGKSLPLVEEIKYDTVGYSTDAQGNVIGVGLHDCKIDNSKFAQLCQNLQFWHSITTLQLTLNEISDLSFLSTFVQIQKLWLQTNQISDLSPLSVLKQLTDLNLQNNSIVNLTPLIALSEIKILDLGSNLIEDLTPLSNLNKVHTLWLSNNNVSNLYPLSTVYSLADFRAGNNKIIDISPLSALSLMKKIYLSDNQINNISNLENLIQLECLWLANNDIINLFPLKKLINLSILELQRNKITDLSPLSTLIQLKKLRLADNQITDVSHLSELSKLAELGLSNNQISNITPLANLSKFNTLHELSLSQNNISDISPLSNHIHLTGLWLHRNPIKHIEALAKLKKLNILDLRYAQISQLPEWICSFENMDIRLYGEWGKGAILLQGNPITEPPQEVVGQGKEAVRNYFELLKKERATDEKPQYIFEVKLLLIGEGRTGKTTLLRRLQQTDAPMPHDTDTTVGIDIQKWEFPLHTSMFNHLPQLNQTHLLANCWDFGGQKIYHGTHQIFFGENSFYILVAETREQKTDFSYWFNTIEQLAGSDAHLLVVINQKYGHIFKFDIDGYSSRFRFVKTIYELDLQSQPERIVALQNVVKTRLQEMPQIGKPLSATYIKIRKALFGITDAFISFDKFREICASHDLHDAQSIKTLSRYLHEVGSITHFIDDSVLQSRVFLNSNWLVKTVYHVLDDNLIKTKQGRINHADICSIWESDGLHFEISALVKIMEKFGLMYPHDQNNYVVPAHLPTEKPYPTWAHEQKGNELLFRYEFDKYMPEGLMSNLIVSLHHYIENEIVWHRGLNLYHENTYAEIIETYGGINTFAIRLTGAHRKELLSIIRHHFRGILKPFKKLSVRELVPCNCPKCFDTEEPNFFEYSTLQDFALSNDKEIQCVKSRKMVNVENLIDSITAKIKQKDFTDTDDFAKFEPENYQLTHKTSQNMATPTVYFSYAWRDKDNQDREKTVDELYNSLLKDGYQLKRDKMDLGFGESISAFMTEIGEAGLILVFTSAKYLKSEYCMWELYEIFRNSRLDKSELQKRVLIFNAEFVALNKPLVKKEYLKYWNDLEKDWKELIDMPNAAKSDREQYDKIRTISLEFGNLAAFIQDINASTTEILSANDFAVVKEAIDKRLALLQATDNNTSGNHTTNNISNNGNNNAILVGGTFKDVNINIGGTTGFDKKITPPSNLKELVAKGKQEQVFAALKQRGGDTENDVIQLEARWNKLKKDETLGLLSNDEANRERAKITNALLTLIDG